MRLSDLFDGGNVNAAGYKPDTEISGLSADSREIRRGFLFAALPGRADDGRRYIDQAIANGAAAILAPPSISAKQIRGRAQLISDANPRKRLAQVAARFHGPQPDIIAAVTGTNGKTSVAHFLRQIWTLLGSRAAALGTIGLVAPGWDSGPGLTTPDPVRLHEMLSVLKRDRIEKLALEASSHGLDQFRLDGVRLTAAAFTNLSRDHLDYHGTMDAYRAAKLRLFTDLLPEGGVAVADADTPLFEALRDIADRRQLTVVSFGRRHGEVRCVAANPSDDAWSLKIDIAGEPFDVEFPLLGDFQISNALCALALAIGCGAAPAAAAPLLSRLTGVPGRMQSAGRLKNGAAVIIDYAHTPDALSKVLQAARAHVSGRLVVAFGCGGDRDKGKRPEMGVAAARLADGIIVTDDNPRSEDPAEIRRQTLAACPRADEIGDRAEAIRTAINNLDTGDMLVIAGKGHEQGQIVAGRTLPFDDLSVARAAIMQRDGAQS